MDVLRHEDKRVELIAAFAAVSVKRCEKHTNIGLNNEQSASLPGREGYKIGPGRGDESSRLQKQTSAAGSRDLCLG